VQIKSFFRGLFFLSSGNLQKCALFTSKRKGNDTCHIPESNIHLYRYWCPGTSCHLILWCTGTSCHLILWCTGTSFLKIEVLVAISSSIRPMNRKGMSEAFNGALTLSEASNRNA
jgi:hypothetical protein